MCSALTSFEVTKYSFSPITILDGETCVTVPAFAAIKPLPEVVIFIFGNKSKKLNTTEVLNTQYITFLAPNLSDKNPPKARIIPAGKLKQVVNSPPKIKVV
ncbi:hypothetical protein D3C85_1034560 [compost metagenome]